jgi:hypothetical protein
MASTFEEANILYTLAEALKLASDGKFLASEHASSIFKKALRDTGFDTAKPVVEKKEVKEEAKI